MTEVVVDTDVVSFLFKSHPIGFRYDPELTWTSRAGTHPQITQISQIPELDLNLRNLRNLRIGCLVHP